MLDRKIKDMDANIELLEDRIKRFETWFMGLWLIAPVLALLGGVMGDNFFLCMSVLLALCGMMFFHLVLQLETFIVIKKIKEGDK